MVDILTNHLSQTWLGMDHEFIAQTEAVNGDHKKLEKILSEWTESHAGEIAEREVRNLTVSGEENLWEQILRKANGTDLSWMDEYGLKVLPEEKVLAQFLFQYPKDKCRKIGKHIVDALLHGFLSQSRDRRDRRHVRLNYCMGQEALVQEVLKNLEERGLIAIVQRPQCLAQSGDYAMMHAADKAACLSDTSLQAMKSAYAVAYEAHRDILLDTCGMIGLGQFGAEASVPQPVPETYIPSAERRSRLTELENIKRETEAVYLSPSDLSFCRVAFPNLQLGVKFPEVFDAFVDLNTMESEEYELIQQKMIDVLDLCEHAEIRGVEGNDTNLLVRFWPLRNPERETKFLNCGGDLNIPHGELFTTPELTGTEGTLHIKLIYLKGVCFQDLRLTFKDGYVVDYSCGGFDDEETQRAYVKEHLLQGHETLTMGEFAIGSNTLAYAIARDMDLVSRMPILLAEKMGPHIAVGDPCFARGEGPTVYNLYDHKEMVARENERTARRHTDKDVYQNVHTDITLAFDELASLVGVTEDGRRIEIIKNGRFVLPGTEKLNEPLERGVLS